MKNNTLAACLALALAALPGYASADGLGALAWSKLARQLAAGDCAGAVKVLNADLAEKSPQAYLLAGSMYEHGACVRRDWKRAMGFYVQAHDGGQPAAALRLAAGFAAPENGPDIAAAIWWAGRSQEIIIDCGIGPIDDPERFVELLRGWSKPRLEHCNYVIGVMSTIAGEVQYPPRAILYGADLDMTLRFLPAVPAFEVKMGKAAQFQVLGVPNYDRPLNERAAKAVAAEFQHTIRQLAIRAVARYPQPAGIDPQSAVLLQLKFNVEKKL
ncbi:MAG TPA: hypothetical protein VF861_01195 [Telluria sp.]